MSLLSVCSAVAAAALCLPTRPTLPRAPAAARGPSTKVRASLSALSGVAVSMLLGGGWITAPLAAGCCWQALALGDAAQARRRHERVRGDLAALVGLVALALRSGRSVEEALRSAAAALPGPAADLLAAPLRRLAMGADPGVAWTAMSEDPALAPLGRALGRSQRTGASVADAVDRLADELVVESRLGMEDRARRVGVKAALPLGVCFLPAFLVLGIVPLVAGLVAALDWSG